MKTLIINRNTVKNLLDNTNWDYQYCGNVNHADAEKACNYLSTQKFSIDSINDVIDDNIINSEYNSQDSDLTIAEFAAKWIASTLAEKRILPFIWSPKDGSDSNKWSPSLIENATFSII